MITKYEKDYGIYFEDQMTKFESFEWTLYRPQIEATISHVFSHYLKGKSILDFCCGDGTAIDVLISHGFENVDGFDGNPRKINHARKIHPERDIWCMDGTDIGRVGKRYDIVYASHCLEHFMYPIEIMIDIYQHLLTRNGELIIILPYPNEESDGHPGSSKLWLDQSVGEISSHLTKIGFPVIKIEPMNFREPELLIVIKKEVK